MLPELSQLLEYSNNQILNRYQNDYPNNSLAAEEALRELLKYFWLNQKYLMDYNNNPNVESIQFYLSIHEEMKEIDDMWHTFLLFTKEYAEFCHHYFGTFIHHHPTHDEEKLSEQEFEIDLTRYLSYIYDNLGEETVKKWFNEY